MSPTLAFAAVAAASVVFVVLQRRGPVWSRIAAKPVPILLLFAALFFSGAPRDEGTRTLVALGLTASLAGDLCLALPGDRFLAGLAAFLAAHLLYVGAFLRGATAASMVAAAPPAAGYCAIAVLLFAYLRPGLGRLRLPVAGYALAICAMAAAACARGFADQCGLAPLGATLFFASDGILAVDRFRRPFAAAQPVLYALYAAGQACITASVWV